MNDSPRLDQYAGIVAETLDELVQSGAKVVVMPPLNGCGGTPEEKINTLEMAVAIWFNNHASSSIERVYITSF